MENDARVALHEVVGPQNDLNLKLAGENGVVWLCEFKKFLRKERTWMSGMSSSIITFDSSLFNPAKEKFLGKGWKIDELEDKNYLALTGFDPSQIVLEHVIKDGENYINGEERLLRLKAKIDFIRLGAKAFFAFKRNPHLIPEDWKKRDENGNIRFIHFDGTILRDPSGGRYSLCLYWHDGEWVWDTRWLGLGWDRSGLSALVPVSSSVRA